MGLTHPRSLLSEIDKILEHQKSIEQILGEELTDVRDRLNNQVSSIEKDRGIITSSPPWEGNLFPSLIQSENKVKDFIAEVSSNLSDESLSGVSLDGLISHAEDALKNRQDKRELEDEAKQVFETRSLLEEICSVLSEIATKREAVADVQSQIDGILDGTSPDDIRNRITEIQEEADAIALRYRVVEDAARLIGLGNSEFVQCPVCKSEHKRIDIKSTLEKIASQSTDDHASELTILEQKLFNIEQLEGDAAIRRQELAELEQRVNPLRASIEDINDWELISQSQDFDDQLGAMIKRRAEREASIKAQIEDHEDWFNSMQSRLSNLKRGVEFSHTTK